MPILALPAARLKVGKQGIRLGRQDDLHLVRRELDHAQDALGQREAARKRPRHDAHLDEGGAVASVGRVQRIEEGKHADAEPLDGGGIEVFVVGFQEAEDLHYGCVVEEAAHMGQ